MDKLSNYIDGQLVPPKTRKYIENINPATNKIVNYIPDSDSRDVEVAIQAARAAYPKWRALSFADRAAYLDKIAAEMRKEENWNALARADSIDMVCCTLTNKFQKKKNAHFIFDNYYKFRVNLLQ